MAGRGRTRVPDPDDWWSSSTDPAPGSSTSAPHELPADTEVWIDDVPVSEPRSFGLPEDVRKLVAVAVLAAIVLIAGLVVSGVFSGGKPRTAASTHVATTSPPPSTASTAAASTVPPPSGTLAPGANGPDVKVLQRALAALGFSPGAVDGGYGPSTQQALARFQRAHRLAPDGVLGPKTLAALTLALRP